MAAKRARGFSIAPALLIIGALTALPSTGGEVYRVVDPNGDVTYTDSPEVGKPKEAVEVPPVNLQPAVKPSPRISKPPVEEIKYTARIIRPTDDSTIPPGQLNVAVEVELKPALQQGHRVQITVDGKVEGKTSASTVFRLRNLVRGTHQIVARVVDSGNQVIAVSPAVAIHVKRHSVNHPNGQQAPQNLP